MKHCFQDCFSFFLLIFNYFLKFMPNIIFDKADDNFFLHEQFSMFSASNFVASVFFVICFQSQNHFKWTQKFPLFGVSQNEHAWVVTIKKTHIGQCLLVPFPAPFLFFLQSKLRRSNYYLTNLFKSKVSNYVSPRKIAGCVF